MNKMFDIRICNQAGLYGALPQMTSPQALLRLPFVCRKTLVKEYI